ncbi:T9SS type A sorting domain-containing protein [Aureispira anguillae]|uniref:T9SS type A sorting domain-containing protein n=1 Tax=Aureispira anguillae TaxID=2864201 RepID=A0A915YCV5_9BACT|nr:T9SS type A sorting domain-containing protein [Aureispira anguillae]BDS10723.1 T9SS type A sorting domain-containing protein [Aureispira anguillae]
MKLTLLLLMIMVNWVAAQNLSINELGRYTDGRDGACEIAAYDSTSHQLIITNAATDSIDIIDVTNPAAPIVVGGVDVSLYGGGINSVVNLNNGYFAAAIEAPIKQDSGKVVFFDMSGAYVVELMVGALPDMLTVTKDGNKVLVACEGEPNDAYTIDPEGSIGIIDISGGVMNLTANQVTLLNFNNAPATIAGSVQKPNTTYAEDLEPEYIAVNEASTLAGVVCQENNVLILVDLTADTILSYKGLGFKDHSVQGNGLDASNVDGAINILTQNVKGVYQPDAIAAYTVNNTTYFISANEGDARDYGGYSSETRVKNLTLDSAAFPTANVLQGDSVLGRLKTFTADVIGDTDGDGDVDELYSYGARSFSIWDAAGNLVWDSGDAIEQYIAANYPTFFNCNDGLAAKMDNRSDDKGAEPEAVTIGKIGTRVYAFVGLERQGGIMVYEVTDPNNPVFENFIHSFDLATGTMLDIAPEGLIFVPAAESHNNKNMLIVSNEVSGTTVIYEVEDLLSSLRLTNSVNEISVYPNPTQHQLTIDLGQELDGSVNYQLINGIGQELKNGQLGETQSTLEISDLPNGIYYLTLRNAEQLLFTQKVVKY